ncbi:MAG: type II secretion system protein [Phycisphaerales bacterium]
MVTTNRTRRAFTMMEALIVIAVIALLSAISLTVAVRSSSSGKIRATEHILKTVDQIITEYAATTGGKVPPYVTDELGTAYPLVDGVHASTGFTQPSLSLFLLEASRVNLTEQMLRNIDSQFIQRTFVIGVGWPAGFPQSTLSGFDGVRIVDGFGMPLRLVHPAFHGGHGTYFKRSGSDPADFTQEDTTRGNLIVPGPPAVGVLREPAEFLRSCLPGPYAYGDVGIPQGHADEGRCIANRPYVYSSGIDRNPGTRMDNIYVGTKPQWPAETAAIFTSVP